MRQRQIRAIDTFINQVKTKSAANTGRRRKGRKKRRGQRRRGKRKERKRQRRRRRGIP